MKLSELSGKEIVDFKRAERLGILGSTDLEIDEQTGQIIALIIPRGKWIPFVSSGSEARVSWNAIKKIGPDMILLDVENEENIY